MGPIFVLPRTSIAAFCTNVPVSVHRRTVLVEQVEQEEGVVTITRDVKFAGSLPPDRYGKNHGLRIGRTIGDKRVPCPWVRGKHGKHPPPADFHRGV